MGCDVSTFQSRKRVTTHDDKTCQITTCARSAGSSTTERKTVLPASRHSIERLAEVLVQETLERVHGKHLLLPYRARMKERTTARTAKVMELLRSEERYVRNLRHVAENFMVPLWRNLASRCSDVRDPARGKIPSLRPSEFASLFAALPDVLRANEALLADMRAVLKTSILSRSVTMATISKLATVFQRHFGARQPIDESTERKIDGEERQSRHNSYTKLFQEMTYADIVVMFDEHDELTSRPRHHRLSMNRAYACYFTNHQIRTEETLQYLRRSDNGTDDPVSVRSRRFVRYLSRKQNEDIESDGLDLASLLIKPCQRIVLYRLYIRDILRLIPEECHVSRQLRAAESDLRSLLACTESTLHLHKRRQLEARIGVKLFRLTESVVSVEGAAALVRMTRRPRRQTSSQQFHSVVDAVHDASITALVPPPGLTISPTRRRRLHLTIELEASFEVTVDEVRPESTRKRSFVSQMVHSALSHKHARWCTLLHDRLIWSKKLPVPTSDTSFLGRLSWPRHRRRSTTLCNDDLKLRGHVFLKDVQVLDVGSHEFALRVHDKYRVLFEADNHIIKDQWLSCIRELRSKASCASPVSESGDASSKGEGI